MSEGDYSFFQLPDTLSADQHRRIVEILRERNPLAASRPARIIGYARKSHAEETSPEKLAVARCRSTRLPVDKCECRYCAIRRELVTQKVIANQAPSANGKYGLSIQEQSDAIDRWRDFILEEHPELEKGTIYVDEGVSGASRNLIDRPAGLKMLSELQVGDHVVFKRLDRPFRKLIDLLRQMDAWDRQGITMHSTDIRLDTSSPSGRMVIHLIGAFAEYEAAQATERNRDIAKRRRRRTPECRHLASGWKPQIGYTREGPKGRRYLVQDKEMRQWMAWIRAMRETVGLSYCSDS